MHKTVYDLQHEHTHDYIPELVMQILHKLEMHRRDEEEYGGDAEEDGRVEERNVPVRQT